MIPIKTASEIEKMHELGRILAAILDKLALRVKPGIRTSDLDEFGLMQMSEYAVKPAFKGYKGFPANICVSVNEEVVHGIPGPRRLTEGDIVSIDLGIERGGYFVDMAKTFPVGRIDEGKQRLIEVTKASLDNAIRYLKPGNRLTDFSAQVQSYVEARNFSVVRDFVGHGIGKMLHEEPQIPNFGKAGNGPMLEDGMVLAVEPMINAGGWEIDIAKDGWTAVTQDSKPSAHFEHTVAIWNGSPQILTKVE